MKKRSFRRLDRKMMYNQHQKVLMMLCNFSIPHIRDVIGFRAGQCTYENKLLSTILHEYGYQSRIASGEAILFDNNCLFMDHKDSFDGKQHYFKGTKISLAKTAGLPIAHHTWIISGGYMIDMTVASNGHTDKPFLFGPLVNGLPVMKKGCSLASMLKEVEKIKSGKTVWSYREFDSYEYQENGKILDHHLGHELGERWLKTSSHDLIEEWDLHDKTEVYVLDEISSRIRNGLQEIADSGNSKRKFTN